MGFLTPEEEVKEAIAWFSRAIVRCGFADVGECRAFLLKSMEDNGEHIDNEELDRIATSLYHISRRWMD